jgi:hypothetical protein
MTFGRSVAQLEESSVVMAFRRKMASEETRKQYRRRGKNRGVLSRLDQEQAGATAVPCAGPEEGADGNAVGLSYLQPAAVDPPKQAQHNTSHYLREEESTVEHRDAHTKSQLTTSNKLTLNTQSHAVFRFLHGFTLLDVR